jgi:hypothetical protein
VVNISDVVVTCAPVPLPAAQDDAEVAKLAWQETPVTDMLVISAAGERIGTVSDMFIDRNGTLTDMMLSRAG